MATVDDIGRERQRVSERLAQLDAERTKLSDQLNDLETAARVLKRFGGKADTTKGRRRGHPAGTTLATPGKHQVQGAQQASSVFSVVYAARNSASRQCSHSWRANR